MSAYLSARYQGAGATLYAVIRRTSDWYVFNGTSLEAWANANIATYAVALTDESGDIYAVAVPTALAAGDYAVDYYEQSGGTPAITDLRLAGETFHWDGTALSNASTVSLSAYALTDLDSVKSYLGITASTYDTILTSLINQISAQIERITGTQFKARDYRERINGRFQRRVQLRHAPVQRVNKIIFGWGSALTVTHTSSGIDATVSVYDDPETAGGSTSVGGLRLVTCNSSGVETATNLSFATYPSVSTLVTAINAVSGWSATTLNNVRTADLYATPGESALSRTVTLRYPDLTCYAYRLDARRASVEFELSWYNQWWSGGGMPCWTTRFPAEDFQGISVSYRGGYESIPADVQLACHEILKEVYMSRTQNTTLRGETLGPFSIQYADLSIAQASRVRENLAAYIDGSSLIGGAY